MSSGLTRKFHQLEVLDSGRLADCSFLVGDTEATQQLFKCNKTILSVASSVFEAMFYGSLAENCDNIIPIPDVDPTAFRIFLEFLYCDEVFELMKTHAFQLFDKLWYVAEKYMVPKFLEYCENFVMKPSTVWNEKFTLLVLDCACSSDSSRLINFCLEVVDWGVEQCRSLYVHIRSPPRLRVDPASVTLHRGDSLRVRCLSPGNDIKRYGQLGYSWTRNGALFQSSPLTVMWEDLYPDGSILKINNIQKSAEYTCIVSNSVKPISKSVYVTVIDRDATIQICHAEKSFGIRWPSSAPGAAIITDCPKRYVGYSRRICEKRDVGNSTWLQPDFSHCIADQMLDIYNKFRALTSGYQMTNCSAILKSSLDYTNRRNIKFLPGEAGFLIDLLQEVEKYLEVKGSHLERGMAAEIILHILDRVMQNVLSLNSQQQIRKLQLLTQSAALNRETIAASQLAVSTTGPASGSADVLISSGSSTSAAVAPISSITLSSSSSSPSTRSKQSTTKSIVTGGNMDMATVILDDESLSIDRLNSLRIYMTAVKMLPFHLKIYGDDLFSDQLYMDIALSNRLHNIMANSTIFASVISYKNLKNFLPKTYYSRGSETKDTDYVLASRIVQTWLFQSNRSNDNLREPLDLPLDVGHVEIIFQHESALKNSDWIPVCGHDAKATFESTWRTDSCITKNLMENITRCICPLSGTFVVMLTKRNHNSTITRPSSIRSFFVVISCGCCLLQSFTALAILLPIWYNRRCAITFLKIQFCVSTSSLMIIYLLGFLKMLPQSWQAIISSTLASLMLLGLSTLIAISLVVHSELMPKRLLITTTAAAGDAAACATGATGVNNATSATTKVLTNNQQQNQQQKQHQQQRRQQLSRGSARATATATMTTTTTAAAAGAEQFCHHNNYYNVSPGISGTIGISWLLPLLYAVCAPLICSIIGKWPQNWWIEVITPAASVAASSAVTITTIDRSLSSTTRYTTDNTEPLISTTSSPSSSSSSSSLAISSGFIIFIVIEVLFIILFVLLLVILTKKLLWLLRKYHDHQHQHHHRHHHQHHEHHHHHHHHHNRNRYNSPIWKRIGLLYRTGIIFLVKLATDGLFITYANSNLNILWGHLFGLFSILLGFSILFCFVIRAENKNLDSLNNKEGGGGGLLNKTSLEDNNYCSDSINSPLNFYANHEKEKDNESGAPLTIVGDDNAGHHLPVTIISTAIPRCQMIAGIPTTKSVGTFLGGIVGDTKTGNSGNIGGVVGNVGRKKIAGNITSACLYEVKKFRREQSKGDNESTTIDQNQSSPLSRCCSISILGVNTTTDSTIGNAKVAVPVVPPWQSPQQHNELIHPDPKNSYYDAYGSSSKSGGQNHRLMHHHHQYQEHEVNQLNQQQMSRMSAIISDGGVNSSPAKVGNSHCPLKLQTNSHEFVGVETLDILQGVSTENIICNRTTTTQLTTRTSANANNTEPSQSHSLHYYNATQQHHKPFVENVLDKQMTTVVNCNNAISNASMNIVNKCSNNSSTSTIATSSVTTQTPKSQKRVTIIETPQIAHRFDPLIPVISVSKSQSIHQSTSQSPLSLAKSATAATPTTTPTPIITITCSSIDDAPSHNNNNNNSNGVDFTINALDTTGNSNNSAIFHQQNITQTTLMSAQQKNEISPDTEEEDNSITGMFDRISHDLDYLLNRTNALPSTKLESEDVDDEIPSEHILHHIPTPPLPPAGSIPQNSLPSAVATNSHSSKHCNRSSIHTDVIIEEPEQE